MWKESSMERGYDCQGGSAVFVRGHGTLASPFFSLPFFSPSAPPLPLCCHIHLPCNSVDFAHRPSSWTETKNCHRMYLFFSCTFFFDFRFSIFDFRFSIFDFRFSIFDFRFSIFDFRFSIFDFRFSIFDFRFSISICDFYF